jgi:uncharacterized membrane protein
VRNRWRRLRESVRSGFWAIPSLCVALAVLLALALVRVDRALDSGLAYTFGAGPDGAREVLSAITTAMITFTGLVFSITIVVLQLTSSQFSPRVLRNFLRDRASQISLGVFVATFVYAVLVLRTVDSGDEQDLFVPALSTTVALVLLLVSVGVFVFYIHHVATSIQVSSIISAIGRETRAAVDRRFPPGRDFPADAGPRVPPAGLPALLVPARTSGVVAGVDEARLVQLACDAGVLLRGRVGLGEYLPEGAPLFEVVGDPEQLDVRAVAAAVQQAPDRSLGQDVAFGFRQLVDIADRALSPGINDPTTAVQALDEMHDLLRRLATRPLRSGLHVDDDGVVRLVLPPERLADYLALALDEVDHYGSDSHQVQDKIDRLLDDVCDAALPEHRSAVEERLRCRPSPGTRRVSAPR